ncbi:MAG: cupin domain-containing protein [Acidobacteria bacterium]|nr:cupin domain-containing protein [Acidobacteriota bacterium]
MKLMTRTLPLMFLIGCAAAGTPPAVEQPAVRTEAVEHITVLPSGLEWNEVKSLPEGVTAAVIEGDLSTREPFTLRLRFPANYEIPAHTHPTTERVTVLYGTLYLATGNNLSRDAAVALPAGSVTVMPPRMKMWGYTGNEPVEIQLNGIGPWGMDLLTR